MQSILWLGSQASYEAVIEAKAKITADMFDKQDERLPELLSVQGNVGIISIKGSLIDGHAGFLRWFGVTGYEDIRDALVAAIQHQGVQSILLDVKSGGGDVAGCHELAQLISRVNTVKPIVTYSGAMMASAALWLGCSVTKVFAAETAMVGSIGILSIHAERSKQLADDGIKVTVIRAGKDKALANPYEPLSAKGQEDMQNNANALYDVFLPWVADQRGVSAAAGEAKFGQGAVFVGKQALDAGLVDKLGAFEDAYAAAQMLGSEKAKKQTARTAPSVRAAITTEHTANVEQVLTTSASQEGPVADNAAIPEGNTMKLPLTTEQLAAMSAGITLDDQTTDEQAGGPESTETKADEAPAEPADPTVALNAQIADLNVQVSALTAAAATATTALEGMKANSDSLLAIVRNNIKTMAIGLGQDVKADTLDADQALAEHGRLSALFKSKFKVGGVAATNTVEEPKPAKAEVDPLYLYAVRSLSTTSKGK